MTEQHPKKPAVLILEDGNVFHGNAFGKIGTTTGEICFNTGMTGYQFRVERFVAVVVVVVDLDAGFFFEIRNSVRGNVIRPVVDVEDFVLGGTRYGDHTGSERNGHHTAQQWFLEQ